MFEKLCHIVVRGLQGLAVLVFLWLSAGLVSSLVHEPKASAGPLPTIITFQETGLAATTACTALAAGAGLSLAGVTGWRAIATAPSTTFTGGTAVCCFRSSKLSRWMPCGSSFNIPLVSGQADVPGPDNFTTVSYGRVAFAGSGVTLTSGSTFTMTYEATQQ